jgi:hypothetical protein
MKRIETLVENAKKHLDANVYKDGTKNGVRAIDIARAVDRIRESEKVLRNAFERLEA